METPVNQHGYLKELETAIATVKASLSVNEETALNVFENAKITEKSSEHLKKEKKKYYTKTVDYYGTVSSLSDLSNEFTLIVNKAIAMANVASADEAVVSLNMALAARSVEAAMQSIAILASDAAAMNAKAATEDSSTKISVMADEAYKKGIETAEKAEEASMGSLRCTILAAKSNAKFINSLIDNLSAKLTSLNAALDVAFKTAKANMDAADKDYNEILSTCTTDKVALEKTTVNYNSAREANNEVTIKPGPAKTLKISKDAMPYQEKKNMILKELETAKRAKNKALTIATSEKTSKEQLLACKMAINNNDHSDLESIKATLDHTKSIHELINSLLADIELSSANAGELHEEALGMVKIAHVAAQKTAELAGKITELNTHITNNVKQNKIILDLLVKDSERAVTDAKSSVSQAIKALLDSIAATGSICHLNNSLALTKALLQQSLPLIADKTKGMEEVLEKLTVKAEKIHDQSLKEKRIAETALREMTDKFNDATTDNSAADAVLTAAIAAIGLSN